MNIGVLDLGTTNTVSGYIAGSNRSLIKLGRDSVFTRTAIYSPSDGEGKDFIFGDDAVENFLNEIKKNRDEVGRLITSPKSCLATQDEIYTYFGGKNISLTEILGLYIAWIKKRLESILGGDIDTFIISHPVEFSSNEKIHQKALERIEIAANNAGISTVIFESEPVAAARKYASDLKSEETFLIADAGGGTTDFTIVKAGPNSVFDVLATSGVCMGGNNIDSAVSDILSPKLGNGGKFKDGTKTLDIPSMWFSRIREWHNMKPFLSAKDKDNLKKVHHGIKDPATKLEFSRLKTILENGMIQEWHDICEGLKVRSSLGRIKKGASNLTHDAEEIIEWLSPDPEDEDLEGLYVQVNIDNIEERFQDGVDKILTALQECTNNAGVSTVDRVVFTGGTCLIPFIRSAINRKTGNPKNSDVAPFSAVAEGLLLKIC